MSNMTVPLLHARSTAYSRTEYSELLYCRRMAEGEIWDLAGSYRRDPDGVWRDAYDATPIPGASDLTVGDLYDPPPTPPSAPGPAGRRVPRRWASRHPDHPLAWVFAHAGPAERGTREPIVVPAAEWDDHAGTPVAMAAPEIHPHNLIGIDGVADVLNVAPTTVRAYLHRRQMPAPISRVGGAPVWPRALIERWALRRVRRGGGTVAAGVEAVDADQTDSA